MKRLLLVAAVAAAALLPAGAQADSWCARTGLTILGEPWLAHEQCVACPTTECGVPAAPVDGAAVDGVGYVEIAG